MTDTDKPLRILCVGETWFGSDARAAFAALRRIGHSVHTIDEAHFVPIEWRGTPARAVRKLFRSTMVGELTARISELVSRFSPDALFVFKGNHVSHEAVSAARSRGVVTVSYFPDVSFKAHGPYIPAALLQYDHVFTAKTYGVGDMQQHGVRSVSFLPPGFDPELHRKMPVTSDDQLRLGCDVSFIGTWSPKKEAILSAVRAGLPNIHLRIWGNQWNRAASSLGNAVMGAEITGEDYARAICASSISLGLLSEARTGSSSGDLITARTFQIPACGAFMLHERNPEVLEYFTEDAEAGFFDGTQELISNISRYLADAPSRERIAAGGLARSEASGYSIDDRMKVVADRIFALRQRHRPVT
jgi:spore maturation protein CgeB